MKVKIIKNKYLLDENKQFTYTIEYYHNGEKLSDEHEFKIACFGAEPDERLEQFASGTDLTPGTFNKILVQGFVKQLQYRIDFALVDVEYEEVINNTIPQGNQYFESHLIKAIAELKQQIQG